MHIICSDLAFTLSPPAPPLPLRTTFPPCAMWSYSLLLPLSLPACSSPLLFPLPLPHFLLCPSGAHTGAWTACQEPHSWWFTLCPPAALVASGPSNRVGLQDSLLHLWKLILYMMAWFYTVLVQLRLSIYYVLIFPSQLIPDPPHLSTRLTLFFLSFKKVK